MTPQSGTVAFRLDGRPMQLADKASSIDLHRPHRILLRSIALAPVEIDPGDHTLSVEFVGAPADVGHPEVGVDFLWVQEK